MPNSLSIIEKQQLSAGSNSGLKWEILDSTDRRIVMAVCFDSSPEIARKNLKMSVGGFYKRWKYLKPVYNALLDDLPNQAVNILKGYSKKAAETLGESLEAQNPADQIRAANSILDRVTPERDKIQAGLTRKVTFEEYVRMSPEEAGEYKRNYKP